LKKNQKSDNIEKFFVKADFAEKKKVNTEKYRFWESIGKLPVKTTKS